MQISSKSNQLLPATQADSRVLDLRVWMVRNSVTYTQIGKALGGITGNAVMRMLKAPRIPVKRQEELLSFGVPGHLLPPALDVPRGRRPFRQ